MTRAFKPAPGAGILGLGSHLPETVRTNDHWPPTIPWRDEERRRQDMLAIHRSSSGHMNKMDPVIAGAQAAFAEDPFRGAVQRRVIADDAETADMEVDAARKALADANVAPEDIDIVLVHSLQPDLLHPSNAPAVQAKCGLSRAAAIALDTGCCSPHVMLAMAAPMVTSGAVRHVLCVCSSAPSRTSELDNPASPIFGDGASAFVVGPVPEGYGLLGQFLRTDGKYREAIVHAMFVEGRAHRDWFKRSGKVRLTTFAPDLGRETGLRQVEFCREASMEALAKASVTAEQTRLFLGPQSIAWLNGALAKSLGFGPDRTLDTFPEVANLGSATLAFNLETARAKGMLAGGDLVLAYTLGAGLTRAAVVFRHFDRRAA